MAIYDPAIFGKSFTVSFSPMAGNTPIAVDSIVSARLYAEWPVSEAHLLDHTNALAEAVESVTSWSNGEATNEKIIVFDAVDDDNPESETEFVDYGVAISFLAEASEQTIPVSRHVRMWRASSIISRVFVDKNDVFGLEPKIDDLLSDTEIANCITSAQNRVIARHLGAKKERRFMAEASITNSVLYLATSYCCRAISAETGDIWDTKREDYMEEFNEIWSQELLEYDNNKDGVIGHLEGVKPGRVMFGRV